MDAKRNACLTFIFEKDMVIAMIKGKVVLCNGVNLSGYWKGRPCGAHATYEYNGKSYCANHYPPLVEQRKVKKG